MRTRFGAVLGLLALLLFPCCARDGERREPARKAQAPQEAPDPYRSTRRAMVESQIAGRDISDPAVLGAMRTVRRHLFVPEKYVDAAYNDHPLPIGHDQTISQPYIVAIMTELLRPRPGMKVLEIGTGSGYQAAVLAKIVDHVYTIEILEPLARSAARRLERLGYRNVTVRAGDGYRGWKEHAPFDGIIVTAAPDHIPEPLMEQLRVGGRMVIPVGDFYQKLMLIQKTPGGTVEKEIIGVRFVPMTGEAQEREKE
jgi:protein-L-isoaspartate(D-aspartate) O-methyltransferase